MSFFKDFGLELGLFLKQSSAYAAAGTLILLLVQFPYDVDRALSPEEAARAREFYTTAYNGSKSVTVAPTASPEDEKYARVALENAEYYHVKDQMYEFARQFELGHKKVLDVGSGRGYLQDVVEDYTGLDIAPSVRHYYHKRFVLGTATSMPFVDDTFDAEWSIWVLEHVPNPEGALLEMRRTVKDGGVLFLSPAWDTRPWQADGYDLRPYSDFDVWGKIIKATIRLRLVMAQLSMPAVHRIRELVWRLSGRPTRLHYHRLTPNYQTYWEEDSDAVNSLDAYEMSLWFRSRGDECLSCDSKQFRAPRSLGALLIRVHKQPKGPSADRWTQ